MTARDGCAPVRGCFANAGVLLLGVGGVHGHHYKLGLVRRLREVVPALAVVEVSGHWAAGRLRDEIGVDDTILLPHGQGPSRGAAFVTAHLERSGFSPDAVVTYRQEWLGLRSELAEAWALPGPARSAVQVAADKFEMKSLLRSLGLEVPSFEVRSRAELRGRTGAGGYPAFIRPVVGIRSEWARELSDERDLGDYADDVDRSGVFADDDRFLVESLLVGHEVDVDLFLHEGRVVYARTSDNLPVRRPFALETGHLMPSILPGDVQDRLVAAASRASTGCGFRDGNVHAELIVLPDGRVFVVEINGRMGGMYIADWHHRVWGVDLVMAELAVSLGRPPDAFLRAEDRGLALAQVCLSAPLPAERPATPRTVSLESTPSAGDVALECWYDGPELEDLAVAGPLNLGAVTVARPTPRQALAGLMEVAGRSSFPVTVDQRREAADLTPLARFCASSPARRYAVRELEEADSARLRMLMDVLSPGAAGDSEDGTAAEADPATRVLCAVDELRPDAGIVATISVHLWRRMRGSSSLCAYLHDLVVLPEYRGAALGHLLVGAAVELAEAEGCYKAYLDCDPDLRAFYEQYGFQVVGHCMVRYRHRTVQVARG